MLLRRGAEHVSATLVVDGHRLVRTTLDNAYYVDRTKFSTIGRNVPVEIANFLKMSDDNVQRQHDQLYWFSATGSALVSNLNKVVDLTKLESWAKAGVSKEKDCKTRVGYLQTRQNELDAEIEDLMKYKSIDADLSALETINKEILADGSRLLAMDNTLNACETNAKNVLNLGLFIADSSALISEWEDFEARFSRQKGLSGSIVDDDSATVRIDGLRDLLEISSNLDFPALFTENERLGRLSSAVNEYDENIYSVVPLYQHDLSEVVELGGDFFEVVDMQKKLSGVLLEFDQVFPDPNPLLAECENLEKLSVKCGKIGGIVYTAFEIDGKMGLIRNHYSVLFDELREKSGGICPVCGNTLNLDTDCCVE